MLEVWLHMPGRVRADRHAPEARRPPNTSITFEDGLDGHSEPRKILYGKNKSGRDEFWDPSRPLMATVTVLTPATV